MKNYQDLNDYELMYMISDNNELATDMVYSKYAPIIGKIASKYLDEARAIGFEYDDLIQEGYIALYKSIRCYDSNSTNLFYTYVVHSIVGAIINLLRKGNALKNTILNTSLLLSSSNNDNVSLYDVIPDSNAILPDEVFMSNELMLGIKEFLYSLDLEKASIFELLINGFQNSEIMLILDLSKKSVDNLIYRIRKKAKIYLGIVEN